MKNDLYGEPLLTTKELANELRVSESHVLNLARRGEIPSAKIGRTYRSNLAAVMEAIESEPHECNFERWQRKLDAEREGWNS